MEYRIAKIIFVQAIFFSLALSTALASVSTKSYFSGMTTSSPIQRRKVLEGYVTGMIEGIVAANATSKRKFGAFLFCVPNDGVIIFSEVVERMRNDIKKDLRLMEFDLDTNVMGTIEIMYPCEANR